MVLFLFGSSFTPQLPNLYTWKRQPENLVMSWLPSLPLVGSTILGSALSAGAPPLRSRDLMPEIAAVIYFGAVRKAR